MKIIDRKGSENGVADHLSSQALLQVHDIKITPWYADMVNYLVIGNLPFDLSKRRRDKLKSESKHYMWEAPYSWKFYFDQVIRRCVPNE